VYLTFQAEATPAMKKLIDYLLQFVAAFNEKGVMKVNQERTKD